MVALSPGQSQHLLEVPKARMVRNSGRSLLDVIWVVLKPFHFASAVMSSDFNLFHATAASNRISKAMVISTMTSCLPSSSHHTMSGHRFVGAMWWGRCNSTHISRQGTGWSMFWVNVSHIDLKNLVMPRVIPLLVSGHLAAVQHMNQCLPLTTRGAGTCE